MKKLLLVLSLFSINCVVAADAAPQESRLAGIHEWETDPQSDLMGLLAQAKTIFEKANKGTATEEELNQVQENWITLQSLLMDPTYADSFTKQNNYKKAGFEQDIPLEIVAGVDKPEEITVQKAILYFTKLKAIADKVKKEEELDPTERHELMTFYNKLNQQEKVKLPENLSDKEEFVVALLDPSTDQQQLEEKTEILMKVMRQGNAIARDPLYVELYKAAAQKRLQEKIDEYKTAAEALGLDLGFVMNIPMTSKMISAGDTSQVQELLADQRLTPPEDHGSLSTWERAGFWIQSWTRSPIDTEPDDAAADAPTNFSEQPSVEANTIDESQEALDLSFIDLTEGDEQDKKPLSVDEYKHPQQLTNLMTLFVQQTKNALKKKYDLSKSDQIDEENEQLLAELGKRWQNFGIIFKDPNALAVGTEGLQKRIDKDKILQYLQTISDPENPQSWIGNLFRYKGVGIKFFMENKFIASVIQALYGKTPAEDIPTLLEEYQFDLRHKEDTPTLLHKLESVFVTLKSMIATQDKDTTSEN